MAASFESSVNTNFLLLLCVAASGSSWSAKGVGCRITDMFKNSKRCRFKLRYAYQSWVHEILNRVWHGKLHKGFQVTFMFHHISGTFKRRCEVMEDEIDRVYRTLVPHVERYPTSRAGSKRLPILIAFLTRDNSQTAVPIQMPL
jgi:hypothetical protein